MSTSMDNPQTSNYYTTDEGARDALIFLFVDHAKKIRQCDIINIITRETKA